MKKLQLDPKKMEVVKKTVTVATPVSGKTKGGVPLDPKEALKFFDAEIKRHDGLFSQAKDKYEAGVTYNYRQKDPYSPVQTKDVDTKTLKAKMDQVYKQKEFLENQKASLLNKIKKSNQAKATAAAKAKEDAKPALQKVGEAVSGYGKEVGGRLKEIWENRDRPSGSPMLKL
jgi:hypothetical protein